LDEKESTLDKSRRQLQQLKSEKAGLDEEKTELGEALDLKEKKISVLQVQKAMWDENGVSFRPTLSEFKLPLTSCKFIAVIIKRRNSRQKYQCLQNYCFAQP
jgi:uncharacterized protein YbaP (TraB family)